MAVLLDTLAVEGKFKDSPAATATSAISSLGIQYWVSPKVWLKGGLGGGQIHLAGNGVNETSKRGFGLLGGAGVEVLQKRYFTIDLQFRFGTAKIEGYRYNNVAFVAAINLN